jgi:ERCC4-related helicase
MEDSGKKKFAQKKLAQEPLFRDVMRIMDPIMAGNSAQSLVHPKTERLRALLVDYFTQQKEDAEIEMEVNPEKPPLKASKVMVFAGFRQTVEEIVAELDKERPLIRSHRFIGQAAAKGEKRGKGLSQKEQLQVTAMLNLSL